MIAVLKIDGALAVYFNLHQSELIYFHYIDKLISSYKLKEKLAYAVSLCLGFEKVVQMSDRNPM